MDMNSRNLTLLTDLYELTMMQGYFERQENEVVVFDVFFRNNPCNSGYSIAAGLEQVIEYIKNLNFSYDDVDYLRKLGIFSEDFLQYLSGYHFTGSIYAIPEGSVIFPKEPLLKVIAPIMEAQLVETAILNIINHQSLIATKTSRIVFAAGDGGVMEFGLRRAQGPDAGIYGARAAMIAGCVGTSNVLTGQMFDVPVMGTHAHSWIMSFPDEYTAFKTYAEMYPNCCTLLVDTYDTLKSGVPNAIRVFDEMKAAGVSPMKIGIRLDSGDLAYLSKKARITSKDCPSFGGVYKLAAIQNKDGEFIPKIKLSENTEKITNPGNKTIFRIYEKENGKIKADLICFADETIDTSKDLLLFDPVETWKKTKLKGGTYTVREMMVPIFINGACVYDSPSVKEIAAYCRKEKDTLWDETKRLFYPHNVYVDLSDRLYAVKKELLDKMSVTD